MTMDMRTKEKVALELKERGTRLFAAKRFRRAELVWHDGVRLFGFLKPEDTGMDPQDFHMNENNRGRQASIPLLLNEAMLMRKRGAFADCETNLNECIENDGNHVKSLFRRGQVRIDLKKWDDAKDDFRRAMDLGGRAVEVDVDRELLKLKKLERDLLLVRHVHGHGVPQLLPRVVDVVDLGSTRRCSKPSHTFPSA